MEQDQVWEMADRLKALRGGLTMEEMAEAAGVDIPTWLGWEVGKEPPNSKAIAQVLECLGDSLSPEQRAEGQGLLKDLKSYETERDFPFKSLGRSLAVIRGNKPQKLAAAWLKIDKETYRSYESGASLPPRELVTKHAKRFGESDGIPLMRWDRLAAKYPEAAKAAQAPKSSQSVHFSSNKEDWPTPPEIFEPLQKRYRLERDVCASPENAKLPLFWTKEDDALSKPWDGRLWMNPPYGRDIGKWLKKAFEAAQYGAIVVCLIPARTDTKWWHDYVMNSAEVVFIKGRITFEGAESGAPFPSAVVKFEPHMNVPFFRSWTPGGEG